MKKVLFTIDIHSVIDVITNSSSELFVGEAINKETMLSLITNIYPDYLREYEELKTTAELDNEELSIYISYKYSTWGKTKEQLAKLVLPGLTFEDMFMYSGKDYRDRDEYALVDINEKNRTTFVEAIDPTNHKYFLFSLDDNPNWDMQEELWDIMERLHLG